MFKTDLYIQVLENLVRVRNVTTGQSVEQRPKQPFSHVRALVGNFTEAEAAIKSAVAEVRGSGLFRRVRILIQPMGKHEGGLPQIESRVLRELALGSGATKVVVWVGEVLSDEAVQTKIQGA
jgi:hypothetical protein